MSDSLDLEIDVQGVDQLRQQDQPHFLLDCREPTEYDTASIEGAVLIPMGELGERLDELAPYRDSLIIVHCHHGGRSLHVARALRQAGFAKSQSMAGGIDAWSQEIDPSIPRY